MTRAVFSALLLACTVIVVYAPVRNYPFISYDDPRYVTNEHVRSGFTGTGVFWAFTTFEHANWHPLMWISLMGDAQLHGDFAGGYHITSVLLHAANGAMLYLFLLTATRLHWPSIAVATLWALHPLRVESVAWIAERKDLLCGLFFLLTLLAYVRYARTASRIAYASTLVFFALGLMSKPMIVTLPFVLLLLDFWPLKRPARAGLLVEKLPLLLMTIASCVVTFFAQRQGGAMSEDGSYPLSLRLGNALWTIARYVRLSIWPDNLAIFYPYHGALPGTHLPAAGVVSGALIIIAITAGGLLVWKRQRAVLIGWLWFLGMLVPVIGIVQAGSQSMADRYTYLPQIGLLIAIAWATGSLVENRPPLRQTALALACIVAASFSVLAHRQIKHWKDDLTLFSYALDVTDHNYLAHDMVGLALSREGHNRAAIEHYRSAIEIKPAAPNLHYNLGRLYAIEGDFQSARRCFEQALALKPDYTDASTNLAWTLSQMASSTTQPENRSPALPIPSTNPENRR